MSRVSRFMTMSLSVKRSLSKDKWGEETYSIATINCRYEPKIKQFKKADGSTFTSQGAVFIDASTTLSVGDLVVVEGVDYRIEVISPISDRLGVLHHSEAYY